MKAINPATEEPAGEHPDHTEDQVQALLRRAGEGFREWRTTPMSRRAELMRRAGAVLRRRRGEFAPLMTREMGKPIAQAETEVEKCAACCDYFADHAAHYLAEEPITTDADRSYVRFDPLGAVLAIMPWNFPFWQVFRFAVPALMAGNVGLLKHAPNVPGCALAIEAAFREAGFPPGVFTTLLVDASEVEQIINDPVVAAVTLTGSTRAGMAVAAQAGRALKKTVLELGGSDPFIVLPDADLEATARAAASARALNTGQSCIAAKRFIVVGEAGRFADAMAKAMAGMKVGDPMDRTVDIGPLARLDLLENLHSQVQRSIAAGAKLLIGGQRVPRRGYFYAPTLLTDVRPGMPAFDEETFGPVAAVVAARDVDEAVELANRSPYGLGASLWTRDLALAECLAERLDAGSVFVNGPVKSDPRLPFGGINQSGYGRELAAFGIREFVNVKTVWMKQAESTEGPQRSE
ncbi:MAG TPA: NAD-dependent succinate-semialdehyde dehydrogenase [Tepidisphaeraceae bacterium]|jgi:succinate-semialdehyde dehydrogenase/glutarate-semialdehyde dehydrogenase